MVRGEKKFPDKLICVHFSHDPPPPLLKKVAIRRRRLPWSFSGFWTFRTLRRVQWRASVGGGPEGSGLVGVFSGWCTKSGAWDVL
jgi:hypothetical protein